MELHEALTQITHIRAQMARSEVFRGFRAVPVAFSGVLALAAAGCQAAWIADPLREISSYLVLWVSVALVSVAATGTEMVWRSRRSSSALRREITWLTIEQFLPSVAAGALITSVIVTSAPQSAWMLPGLWQVLFSLGIFASHRLLPRQIFWVAVFYMACGIVCLASAKESFALAPLAMGIPFGAGQLAAAAVLYWTLERGHESD